MSLMTDLEVSQWLKSEKAVFENVTQYDYRILHKIHPFKQNEVAQLIELCKQFPVLAKIIVFGSSITYGCSPHSDLDIAVDWNCKAYVDGGVLSPEIYDAMQAIQKNSKYNIDILQIQGKDCWDSGLSKSIEKGVVIYENYV